MLAAFVFGLHGYMMLFRAEQARRQFPWAADVPDSLKGFIGVAEVLGAIGLIVPAATGILPWLTPLAAIGLAALMVLAALFHITRREWPNVVFNVVLGAIAAFAAYARYAVPLS
ncbi:MAG: DoxX family protein [Chloroflexota bacterium]